ncbi:MAG: hypothetical protein H6819_00595 [Phycisphaerales bacterium]|nr:hypothetical protein [Phycisphaerales bacterium]MCB9857294.1 hypothetical protein [Phycisphaerales bacterium]MCB9862992.1 hypothetical protein [Phycisphaerales bacterium]
MTPRLSLIATLLCASPLFGASVTLQVWNLSTTVDDGFLDDRDNITSVTVQNPFQQTHNVMLGDSSAMTTYNFMWQAQSASFLIDAIHSLKDIPTTSSLSISRSVGTARMHTESDLLVTVDAQYTYHSLGSEYYARLGLIVADTDAKTQFINESHQAGPAFLGASVGVFSIQESTTIPAGTNFGFSYSMLLTTFGGGSSAVGHAAGHVNITMQVIPEPAAFLLLIPALPFMRRRARTPS